MPRLRTVVMCLHGRHLAASTPVMSFSHLERVGTEDVLSVNLYHQSSAGWPTQGPDVAFANMQCEKMLLGGDHGAVANVHVYIHRVHGYPPGVYRARSR